MDTTRIRVSALDRGHKSFADTNTSPAYCSTPTVSSLSSRPGQNLLFIRTWRFRDTSSTYCTSSCRLPLTSTKLLYILLLDCSGAPRPGVRFPSFAAVPPVSPRLHKPSTISPHHPSDEPGS